MQVTLLTRDFAKTLNTASRFASNRANLPILSNVALSAEKSKLTLLATDLEISLAATLGAKVIEEGSIAAPSKTLTELVTNLGGTNIDLVTDGETVTINSEGFKSKLNGVNDADYPTVVRQVSENATALETRDFIPALNKVLFATSTDEARPTLTGVLFIFAKDEMSLVATDGFRLSQKKFSCEGLPENTQLIVPRRILAELPRLATDKQIQLELREADHQVVFGLPNLVLTSRVIEGDFPNFERIIPKLTKATVNVSKEELARAVKLASVFARDNANTIKLSVKENALEVSAESNKLGSENLSIEASVTGEPLDVGFNFRFIEEFLNVVGGDNVELKLNTQDAPSIFNDPKDATFLHLIMPVRG